jgi:hypothetical protein
MAKISPNLVTLYWAQYWEPKNPNYKQNTFIVSIDTYNVYLNMFKSVFSILNCTLLLFFTYSHKCIHKEIVASVYSAIRMKKKLLVSQSFAWMYIFQTDSYDSDFDLTVLSMKIWILFLIDRLYICTYMILLSSHNQ